MKKRWTDKQRLDALQSLLGTYTGRVSCRWSEEPGMQSRGWRLHESSLPEAVPDVRQAIDAFLNSEQGKMQIDKTGKQQVFVGTSFRNIKGAKREVVRKGKFQPRPRAGD